MNVLSIKRHYAELIMSGVKKIENRTWRTHYQGELFIHASGTGGEILGSVYLVNCIHVEDLKEFIEQFPEYKWIETHEHACGPWYWILEDPAPFKATIPAKGKLNIWTYSPA